MVVRFTVDVGEGECQPVVPQERPWRARGDRRVAGWASRVQTTKKAERDLYINVNGKAVVRLFKTGYIAWQSARARDDR